MIRVGIIGGGWPGVKHAEAYRAAGGFKVVASADLIPDRRSKLIMGTPSAKQYADAKELIADPNVDAVSVCLPNNMHASTTIAALRAGKHVVCEAPPTTSVKEAKQIEAAAAKAGKAVVYALQRRFGGAEQAARQAVEKAYAGSIYHVRASWTRTRAVPMGTGWYADPAQSGGGAMIDLGIHMLDLAWTLLGQPAPASVFAATQSRLGAVNGPVEEAAFALLRFANGATIELASSWAMNQPPQLSGTACRVSGETGAVDVYTPHGPVLYRGFTPDGKAKQTPLKLPKATGYVALMRHFRECVLGKVQPITGTGHGVQLMQMVEAIYKSAQSGKSVAMKGAESGSPSDFGAKTLAENS